jgi:hypothetical protein
MIYPIIIKKYSKKIINVDIPFFNPVYNSILYNAIQNNNHAKLTAKHAVFLAFSDIQYR